MAHIIYTDASGASNNIEFDAILQESVSQTAQVTQFPVEDGATISDHSQPDPLTIYLEAHVSDTPVRDIPTQSDGVTGSTRHVALDVPQQKPSFSLPSGRMVNTLVSAITGPGAYGANVLQFDGKVTRVANVFEALNRLLVEGTPCSVVVGIKEFSNMVISNVGAPRDSSSGTGISFTIDLVQIQVVSSRTTAAPKPKQPRAKPKVDNGNKNTTPAPTQQQAPLQSLASSLF